MRLPLVLCICSIFTWAAAVPQPQQRSALQDIVTWDNSSIFVRGERIYFLSGEFHPFRLPSPGLWLDIFQKIKAMGYSGVSFYVMWALVEGEPGHVRTDGVFALDEFFNAAKQAGIYLLARPGPYINAEVTGGGFPGWVQRVKGQLRSSDPDWLNAIKTYINHIGKVIGEAEITKGGPVILFQPENEYSICSDDTTSCLDKEYMAWVENAFREAGITVPFINNDAVPFSNWAPGSATGAVDIYGYDMYPFGWGDAPSSNPTNWTRGNAALRPNSTLVQSLNITTSPRLITEFQGGAPDPWAGVGVDMCAALINNEFERIFYKMNYAVHTTLMNLYMTYGGTNWGNLGHPLGYTSYDVGAAIREDRQLVREKYAEMKLQGNFHRASPAFLTSKSTGDTFGVYTNTSTLVVSPLVSNSTKFYIVRHDDVFTLATTTYTLHVETTTGNLTIPQLGGALTLNGRDSKIHVTDYDVGGIALIYSSAEVFTWKKTGSKSVLLLYGGLGELHELSVPLGLGSPNVAQGGDVKHQQGSKSQVVQWTVSTNRTIVSFGNGLDVYLLWRNDAYNYWTLDLSTPETLGSYTSPSRLNSTTNASSLIVKAGYLLRNATVMGTKLDLVGDLNATTEIEVISAPAGCCTSLSFNGKDMQTTTEEGRLKATIDYQQANISLPDFSTLDWRYTDSLPEIQPGYDDSNWTVCNLTSTNNPRNFTTPTSLYSADYGYHSGSFIYRGHFIASGNESTIFLQTQGGNATGHSIWLNTTFLGSWIGSADYASYNQTLSIPGGLSAGQHYVLTVLIDQMGYDENFYANTNGMKAPRGIYNYALSGNADQTSVSWKTTGNFGGEHYYDHSRGPLNEGAIYAERQGYHLPSAPSSQWTERSPMKGVDKAGVGFFATNFSLDIPAGYDVPLSVALNGSNATDSTGNFRVQIFVNGWQFGKYINNIGPQTSFPVPEGILNYHGVNYLALTLWSLDKQGSKLDSVKLSYDMVVQTGRSRVQPVVADSYRKREGSY